MSLLAPLYALAALAISLPILFHLIRRTPRGRQPFSSLMFLVSSPPRITRRSRIEHWLLLLLRAAALILLALAFARPFLRETARHLSDDGTGRRWAIVIDTSASMRRGDLWRTAVARAEKVLTQIDARDDVGLFTYDDQLQTVVDWDEPVHEAQARVARVRQALAGLSPTWGHTNLGQALAAVADRLMSSKETQGLKRSQQIVLITDLQQGADVNALQAYEWPTDVRLVVEQLQPTSLNNAGISLMGEGEQPEWRVRVANASGSTVEQFQVGWHGAAAASGQSPRVQSPRVDVHVPPGTSRVVKLPSPPPGVDGVTVTGDSDDFDNTCYFSPRVPRELRIVVFGNDAADDAHGVRFFLERVWSETPHRKVQFTWAARDQVPDFSGTKKPHLVVVACPLPAAPLAALQSHVQSGGMAMLVAGDQETAASLTGVFSGIKLVDSPAAEPAPRAGQSARYSLLSDIDFDHPVFATMAGARYNDFTRVRIWKHQRFALDESAHANVLARFDDGDPAIWEQTHGTGKLVWFACGWRPNDSQLALSSKFVPLLSGMLDHLTGGDQAKNHGLRVHDAIPISTLTDKSTLLVTKPDGQSVTLAANAEKFAETDQPGVYRLQSSSATLNFAVNLSPSESDTSPMTVEQLEQFGVRVGREPTAAEKADRQRQMRDIELESRQKLWRWMLVAVLGVMAVETVLAGRSAQVAKDS